MEQIAAENRAATRIVVLADDLIWGSRLRAAIERAGAYPVIVRSLPTLETAVRDDTTDFAVIDLTARLYDGIEAIRMAASAGAIVLAVAQHDDVELRRRALAAGAKRVLSYNKLFNDGPQVMTRLVDRSL